MARYIAKGRGRWPKIHIATGQGNSRVTGCGLRYNRNTVQYNAMKWVRVSAAGPWPEVNCSHCLRLMQFLPPSRNVRDQGQWDASYPRTGPNAARKRDERGWFIRDEPESDSGGDDVPPPYGPGNAA